MSDSSPFYPGLILENRYKIQKSLGQGGFGKTYLAENLNRFGEQCVIKELAPQIRDPELLRKAAELFRREAQTLYRLSHPQIPEFREFMTVSFEGADYLLMVQQYMEGETYEALLEGGKRFQPQEIAQLLFDVLPVLSYIHRQGVIHRDIAPDNLICDRATGKPILIDFGGVKQVAATALQQFSSHAAPTRLEKVGYTPDEQKLGHPTVRSDLYMLGATVIVLLTGKKPHELYDENNRIWNWQDHAPVSSEFADLLNRLLAANADDRYPSAQAVLEALEPLMRKAETLLATTEVSQPNVQPSMAKTMKDYAWVRWQSRLKTLVVAPKAKSLPESSHNSHPPSPKVALPKWQWPSFKFPQVQFPLPPAVSLPKLQPPQFALPLTRLSRTTRRTATMIGTGVGCLLLGFWGAPVVVSVIKTMPKTFSLAPQPDPSICQRFNRQMNTLGASVANAVVNQTDLAFHRQHPELKGRSLTKGSEDARLRQDWCQIGLESLQKAETGQ